MISSIFGKLKKMVEVIGGGGGGKRCDESVCHIMIFFKLY